MPEAIELTANAMGDSGKVMILPRGEYSSVTPYEELDCVYYQGRSYLCKQASTGHAPTDTTYWQPMTPDSSAEIQALTNQLEDEAETRAELGAHNLLPPFVSQTSDGVIFTVDANGVVDIDGESTSTYSETRVNFKLKAGTYTLSGIPSAGYGNSKLIILLADLDHTAEVARDTGSGATFTLASDTNLRAFIYAYRAYGDFDHVKVYPMIRLATDADPTYQPYAMTNKELTDVAKGLESTIYPSDLPNNTDLNSISAEKNFYLRYDYTYTNIPSAMSGQSGRLEVKYLSALHDRFKQLIYPMGFSATAGKIYMRDNAGGAWNSWYEISGTTV